MHLLIPADSNWLDYFAILDFQWLLIPEQYAWERRVVHGVNFEVCVELSAFYAYYLFFRLLFLALEVAALQLLRGITLGLTPGLPGNLASAIVNEVMGMAAA